jgi:microcystin-dependent protein
MPNDYFKDRIGYEDLFIDSAGTNQSFPRATSTGGSQNVRGMNASLTPLLLATRTLSLYDQGQLSASEVDTAIAQVCASLASIHKFQNESILDGIQSSGSGSVISDEEREKLNNITDIGSGKIITAAERNKLQEIVGLTQEQIDAITNVSNILPVGTVIGYPVDAAPTGFFECNGGAVSRATYSDLFSIIGVQYGSGDGSTTFNLPDYRGEFLRGWSHGSSADPDRATRTDRGDGTTGNAVGTKQNDAFQGHTPVATIEKYANSLGNASGSTYYNAGGGTVPGGTHNEEFSGTDDSYDCAKGYLIADGVNGTPRVSSESRGTNVNVMWCIRYSL